MINTDENDRVNYIELSPTSDLRVFYKGVPVFEAPVDEVALLVGGPVAADDDLERFDLRADVGLMRCDEKWDAIGVGAGEHFARLR